MNPEQITLLRAIPIEDLASRLGLDVRHHKALCPFHNDHHPSLSFNVRRNTYRCFVCDAHGGTIDLVMHYLHKDFKEACQWLSNGSNQPPVTLRPSPAGEGLGVRPEGPGERLFDASRYEKYFDRPYLSPAAKAFLFDTRRLDPRVVRWCRLTSWRDRQGTDWLQIPYYDRDGRLVGVQNRNLSNLNHNDNVNGQPRFRFPKGAQCGIYNLPILNRLQPGEALYIAEGCSDCWALLSAGHKAIAIPSATLLSQKDKDQLSILLPASQALSTDEEKSNPAKNSQFSINFHMFPDRDLPGERLFLNLQRLLPNLTHHHLPPDCKDYSEYYLTFHLL